MSDIGTMAIVATLTIWLIGAALTAARLKEVSSDSPVVRFVIAILAWPLVWMLK